MVVAAQIEIVHLDTGATFRTTANEQGLYAAPGLAVGRYEVRTTMQGCKKAVRSGITLQVNQNALVNISLQVGQVAESVEVAAEAALVDTSGATLGQMVENRRVRELPLNGRSALALTMMTAGVGSNSGATQSGFGDRGIGLSAISINGGPNSMNAQMLDGNNNTLVYIGEAGVPPAVDAVEEFKVQSGTMPAEYGFTAGGGINLVTKSGTNLFHGAAYEFLRNDALDARNTFAAKKLPLRYNQYGGSLGGPLIENKTFGFFNWEQYLPRKSTPRISSVPISTWRAGNFSDYRDANGVPIPIYDQRLHPERQLRGLFDHPGGLDAVARQGGSPAIKNTRITECVNVQFRAEAFSFLNSVNLNAPNSSFSPGPGGKSASATFGTITGARDARGMQLGLKVIF